MKNFNLEQTWETNSNHEMPDTSRKITAPCEHMWDLASYMTTLKDRSLVPNTASKGQ